MKKVNVNGTSYVGKLNKKNNVLSNAMESSGTPDFGKYLMMKNLDKLQNIEFGGPGVSYSISPLSATEKLDLASCKMVMKHAKKISAAGTENKVFSDLLGK